MKLILDVDDPMDYTPALSAAQMVMQSEPNQKIGSSLSVTQRGQRFSVTRNQESYTVEYS